MGENDMKELADALWGYFLEKHLKPYLSDSVCYFMATVTTAPANGVIGIQRPFDDAINLPYAWSAANLRQGQTCLVIVFGDISNAIVIGAGDMSDPGIRYVFTFATGDWTRSGSTYTLTLPAATHKCGKSPAVDVFTLDGTSYKKFYGLPSGGWTISVNTDGDITLTASAAFSGKLVIG
jgi:hypothetical protein